MKAAVLAILSLALTAPVRAQWLNYPTPGIPRTADGKPNLAAPTPRTADGKPDLTGVWNRISPKYDANIAADLKPGDIQPWAQALVEKRKEDLGKDHMAAHCLPFGPEYSTAQRYVKIVQTPTLIVMLDEDLTYRQIFLDGRPLESDPQPAWMGYSVGHWDGDTLVVDSAGFNDKTWLDTQGHPHSEALHTTERYRRTDLGHLEMETTIQDPKVYAKPFKVAISSLLAPDTELLEAVCGENNKDLDHWIGKASDDEKSEVKVPRETLAKYAGIYVEQPKLWRTVARTIVITAEGDALFGDLDGRGKTRIRATSPSNFVGIQGGVEFVVKDPQTAPTDLFVKHVSGNYRFARTK